VWWCTSIIPTVGSLGQKDLEFKAHLGYIVRACLKKTNTKEDNIRLSVMVHTYNLSYEGGLWSEASLGGKSVKTLSEK
jgi:hypothetical protein